MPKDSAPSSQAKNMPKNMKAKLIQSLERRILFDAAGAAVLADAVMHDPFADDASFENPADIITDMQEHIGDENQQSNDLIVLDSAVEGWNEIYDALKDKANVVVIHQQDDPFETIASFAQEKGLSSLGGMHIVSHGADGALQLGGVTLNASTIESYAGQLGALGGLLAGDGDIMLYGCDISQGEAGQDFTATFAALTGADVASSDDVTGADDLGGDWVLENHIGVIETQSVSVASFRAVLPISAPTDVADLQIWLDGSDATTIIDADGDDAASGTGGNNDGFSGSVATWSDKSGNGNDVSATSSEQPLYNVNQLNGHAVLTFDGSNDRMTGTVPMNAGALTTFAVYERSAITDREALWEFGSTGENSRNALFLNGATPSYYDTNPSGGDFDNFTGSWSLGQYYIVSTVHTGSTVTAFQDGVQTLNASTGPRQASSSFVIGDDNTSGDEIHGDIAEFLAFDRALNATEMADVLDYLNTKWFVSNTAPTFTASGPFSVDETAIPGDVVGTVTATDADVGDVITYSIVGGNSDNIFEINATSGQISIYDASLLDFETTSSYALTVRATDNGAGTLYDEVTVNIAINDVAIDLDVQNFDGTQSLNENALNALPQFIDTNVTLVSDNADFDGGFVVLRANGDASETLSIFHEGTGAGQIGVSGSTVTYGGVTIGTIVENGVAGNALRIDLNSNASRVAVENLLENLTYQNTSDNPAASVDIDLVVNDGSISGGLTYEDEVLADTPAAYWQLNETAGSTATNLGSLTGVNGTYSGGVTLNAPPLHPLSSGSADFDGVNDYISIPNNSGINTSSANVRSIEMIFNADTVSGRQVLYEEGGSTNAFNIYIDNGNLYVNARDSGEFGPFNFNTPVVAGQTYHVAFVFDPFGNGLFEGFLDGVSFGSAAVSSDMDSHSGAIGIGAMNSDSYFHDGAGSGSGFYFNGRISDVAIYNSALSGADIQRHYNASLGGLLVEQTITITPENDAPVATPSGPFTVFENSPNGTVVGTAVFADPDTGDTLTYSIQSGNTDGIFAINPTTGDIVIADNTALDYEVLPNSYDVVIRATDNGTGALFDEQTVTIDILDLNDNNVAPQVDVNNPVTVNEGGNVTITDGDLLSSDPDGVSGGWYDSNWNQRQRIYINSGVVDADLTDFSLLLTADAFGPDFWANVQNNGGDIVVTSGDGVTRLDRELISIDTATETIQLYVRVPLISSTVDTALFVYFDNGAATEVNDVTTWRSEYTGVWHFEDDIGSGTEIDDSSQSDNDGFARQGLDGDNMVSGVVGNAFDFNDNEYIALENFYSGNGAIPEVSVSAWVNTTFNNGSQNSNWSILDFDRSDFFNVYIYGDGRLSFSTDATSGGIDDFYDGSGTRVNDGAWHHVAAVYDGTDKILYVDGVEVDRVTNPHSGAGLGSSSTRYGFIGDGSEASTFDAGRNNLYYDGQLDNIRLYEGTYSAAWVATEYLNASNPSSLLIVDNAESFAAPITYTVATDVGYGTLYNNGVAMGVGDTFTQADIAAGFITYQHDDSENFTDQFTFNIDDGTDTVGPSTFTINITPVNEAPTITAAGPFAVAENASVGDTVFTVSAADGDAGDSIASYAIISGNADGIFGINATTGEITIADTSLLDFETGATSYALQVRVTDQGGLTTDQSFTINITDSNDSPVLGDIIGNPFSNPAVLYNESTGNFYQYVTSTTNLATASSNAASALLAGQAGHLVTITSAQENTFVRNMISNTIWLPASDAAVEGEWRWTEGPEAGVQFWQGNGSGFLVSGYEGWTGSEPNDNGAGEDFALMFSSGNWNDTNGGGNYGYVIEWEGADVFAALGGSINEVFIGEDANNGDLVADMSATDQDVGDTLTYSIQSGDPSSVFTIDPVTGVIRVNDASQLDFETLPNVYDLVVRVTDDGTGNLYDEVTLRVSLQDRNDAPVLAAIANVSIDEHTASSVVMADANATDNDGDTITYSIVGGNTNNVFSINASTGVITVSNPNALDYETGPTSYNLTVRATDNGTPSYFNQRSFTVSVNDINEAPTFDAVDTVLLANPGVVYNSDTGNFYQYISSGANYANAQINAAGSLISGFSGYLSTITSANENAFVRSLISASIWLGADDITTEGAWYWGGGSGAEAGQQFWSGTAAGSSVGGYYENWNGGEPNNSGSNEDGVEMRTNGTWNDINVSNSRAYVIEWDGADILAALTPTTFSIGELDTVGTSVSTQTAYDVDSGQSLTYSIQSGNTDGIFGINATTGEITIVNTGLLNYETGATSYNLVIRATDNGAGALYDENTITINVTDENDTPVISNANNVVMEEGSTYVFGADNLFSQDEDNSAAQLTYEVTSMPQYGVLMNGASALSVGDNFTQADINAGNVRFVANFIGDARSTSLSFTVNDGALTVGPSGLSIDIVRSIASQQVNKDVLDSYAYRPYGGGEGYDAPDRFQLAPSSFIIANAAHGTALLDDMAVFRNMMLSDESLFIKQDIAKDYLSNELNILDENFDLSAIYYALVKDMALLSDADEMKQDAQENTSSILEQLSALMAKTDGDIDQELRDDLAEQGINLEDKGSEFFKNLEIIHNILQQEQRQSTDVIYEFVD